MRHARLSLLVLVLVLAAVALGSLAAPAMGDEKRSDRAAAKQVRLTLKDSPYGHVLFANGFAMYAFTRDEGKTSRCYRACAVAWPPLRARGEVFAGEGVDESLVGKTRRRDGTRQLTYDGQPLYGYVHDPRGRVLCHDVVEFGGTWLAILGSGDPAP